MSKMIKRILTMAVALALLVGYLPGITLPVRAADIELTTSVDGLGVSYSDLIQATTTDGYGDSTLTATASGTTVEMTITGGYEYDSSYQRYNSMSTTLTLTNTRAEEARLTFLLEAYKDRTGSSIVLQYEGVTLVSSGEIELDDGKIKQTVKITASGNMEFVMPANTSITFTMTSAKLSSKSQSESLKLSLKNLHMYVDQDIETTFKAVDPAMGSYTVNGTEITADQKITNKSQNYYSLVATAADGYVFSGWYSETKGEFISFEADASVQITENMTVYPVFIAEEDALWAVGDANFTNVDDAFACAALSIVKEVALLKDYTLTEDLTIPAGITLLIPFDADNTCYTTEPEATPGLDPENDGSLNGPTPWEAPYAYRTLTLAEGVTITVNGSLSVSAQHSPGSQLTAGSPHGPCGFIKMSDNSQIVVNDKGGLYAWGYIVGSGTVTVNSGATVYENLQVTDFRGGSASGNMAQNTEYAVFPFSQYYVQNVEVPMTIHSGAAEVVYISIFAANSINSIPIDFIGTENAMFRMGEGAYVVKSYDGENDRLVVDTYGDVSLYALTITHPSIGTVASSDFDLPITNNISINVNSGTTTINQNIALLPGAEVYVDADAVLVVSEGWNVYVYDSDEWLAEKFVHNNLNVSPIAYSYANGTTKVRSNADLADARIDVNGVMFVSGYLYTTEGGADICSSEGTGKVILWVGNGEAEVTYQVTQSGTAVFYTEIPLSAAQLKNGDGTYTDTSEADPGYGEAYYYNAVTGTWDTVSHVVYVTDFGTAIEPEEHFNIDIEWTLVDGEEYLIVLPGYDDDAFLGWDIDGDGEVDYVEGDEIAIRGNVTLYAIWEAKIFNVYVDGVESGELIYGADLKGWIANLEEPTKSGHNFAGWVVKDADGNVYTGDTMPAYDVYITASWTEIKKVTYTYLDKDGQELKTEEVEDGAAPSYPEVPATIDSTYYTYTFDKWTKEEDADGNVTFTATYTATAKTFDVTYMNGSDVVTEDQANEANDWTITVTDAAPTKDGYNFKGWATTEGGEVVYTAGQEIELTANLTLYAVWECLHANATVTYANDGETHSVTETCSCGYSKTTTGVAHVYDETTHACVCGAENHVHDRYEVVGDIHQSFCSCGKLLGEGEHAYIFDEAGLTCTCVCGAGYNGIYEAANGDLYWIEDGVAVADKGLVRVVENGEAYYYYFVGYTAVTNGVYWVENNNDLLPKWDYAFGTDGIIGCDDALNNSETLNHQIVTYDGVKYYTIDGIKVHYGLFEMDGGYYYARRDGSLVCGKTYWITDTHGLMDEGSYTFDEEGRMIMDGIVNGYYYVAGVRTYAGLIKIDGSYYYVRTSGAVATGSYWITKTNGLMPQGSYEFDEDGKMLNAPAEVPEVEDAFTGIKDGYYYENGKLTYAGLIVIDGKYYYVRTGGQVATGRYWITKTNGLMEAGNYYFDETGAMILE